MPWSSDWYARHAKLYPGATEQTSYLGHSWGEVLHIEHERLLANQTPKETSENLRPPIQVSGTNLRRYSVSQQQMPEQLNSTLIDQSVYYCKHLPDSSATHTECLKHYRCQTVRWHRFLRIRKAHRSTSFYSWKGFTPFSQTNRHNGRTIWTGNRYRNPPKRHRSTGRNYKRFCPSVIRHCSHSDWRIVRYTRSNHTGTTTRPQIWQKPSFLLVKGAVTVSISQS